MINKQTIISAYDEKLTLVQWLKSVNKALDEAVLTNVEIAQRGNATFVFVFTFEDGTQVESNEIIINQGESINGASIRNGHLYLTLTNGDELDAGNVKPVTSFSINASQHLIVNYGDGTSQDLGAIFSGNVNIDGTLNANVVDGVKVTGNEIVEKMGSGYSIYKAEKENITHDIVYAGAVKNGNKLTLVLFSKITRTGDVANDFFAPCYFYIPQAIADKIYPTTLGSLQNAVASKQVTLYSAPNVSVTTNGVILKVQQGNLYALQAYIYNLHNLVVNTEYQYRIELTFLLSDNLAGN